MQFLKELPVRILILVLLLQGAAYYAVASRQEVVPAFVPLSAFPRMSGGWVVQHEYSTEKEVQDVLRADDTLNRVYVNPATRSVASLFMAYFKTQRYGQSPHSPKNCLPGSGWQPIEDTRIPVAVPGREAPIVINKYVIAHGDEQSVVLYWYQSHRHVIAGELSAKLWLVADAIRYHRSDTALVRVIVPVQSTREAAEQSAIGMVQAVYPDIVRQFPQ